MKIRSTSLTLENIQKRFGNFDALKGISLSIPDNHFFALLGPSGCGKTTLLRIIAGFEQPDVGRVSIGDLDISELPPYKRDVNIVFQNYALFPHLSVAENISFSLKMKKVNSTEIARRVDEALALVKLEGFHQRMPHQLSGGQAQRVALARAFIGRPKVLLLDEPLAALDLKLRVEMQVELKRLQRQLSMTFVLVTHDQDEAMGMADTIAVMNQGQVMQCASPREVYECPANEFVASFMGESNVFAWQGRRILVRPEHLAIRLSSDAYVNGTVEDVVYLGKQTLINVKTADVGLLKVSCVGFLQAVHQGDSIGLWWDRAVEL